jgi:hypothetical protein
MAPWCGPEKERIRARPRARARSRLLGERRACDRWSVAGLVGGKVPGAAIHRETLDDGSIRLSANGCSFVYTRLRPGAVLVTIEGRDLGALGDAPLDELAAEIRRYPPVDLYMDTRDATFAATSVSDAWTSFFSANHAQLRRVRILVSSRFVHLVVEVAKLFSRTGELIQIDADAARFDEAVARVASATSRTRLRHAPAQGGEAQVAPARAATPARSVIQREVARDGSLRLANDRCAYVIRRLRPGTVLMTITGHDGGEFGEAPLDEIRAEIDRFGPVTLFINLRDVTVAGSSVSDVWTAFFASGGQRLKRVRILVGSRLIQLTVALSKEVSRAGQLIQIDTELADFEEALARETSGTVPPANFE